MKDNGHSDLGAYFQKLFDTAVSRIQGFKPEHFIPHPNTVLVRVPPPESQTPGGIHIPDLAQQEKRIGVVLAVHPSQNPQHPDYRDAWSSPAAPPLFPYQAGDVVFFRSYGGEKLPFEGHDDLFVLQYRQDADSDILGKFDTAGTTA